MKRVWLACGLLVAAVVILAVGGFVGVLVDRAVFSRYVAPSNIPTSAEGSFKLMAEAWNQIQGSYVDRSAVVSDTLTYGAISGMVDALGDTGHSRFMSPQMVKEESTFTSGQYEGIGAYVDIKNGNAVIVSPMDGSPAQKAGLRPGDIILKVDGQDVTGLPLDQVTGKIKGPAGTSVTLTIQDPTSGDTRDVTVVRAQISIKNVTWSVLPGTQVAHLRIAAFSQNVTKDLEQALTDIQNRGLKGVILDLRSNPGGLLDEAVGTASQFLGSGNVLLEQNAQGKRTPVAVQRGGVALDLPLVVLIDQGTASASEIVSGALQDAQRAKLVGETTFGTGTVLNQFPLSDGSAMLLATEEWLTPSGRVIWHQGIKPDVEVTLPSTAQPLTPEQESGMSADQLQASGDAQLLKALELLAAK